MNRAEATRHSAKGQALYDLLERAPFPVIAAVRGFCVGGGCEMVQACDFILASEDASFGQPEINIGVIPGWGGSRRLTRTIGPVRARRWIMTGERVGAAKALQDGFLDRVVPPAELLPAAIGLGTALAAKSAEALAAAKYLVNYATDPNRGVGMEFERGMWGRLFETAGQREGMRAFLEKRPAAFSARRAPSEGKPPFPWDSPASRARSRPRGRAPSRGRLGRASRPKPRSRGRRKRS
jgi:enoyl-CoA hydratase/carnithine racemase